MSLRSPLARVLGLGSAKEGATHWWIQRLTAVALLPLTLWFAVALLAAESLDYAAMQAWLAAPWNAILLGLLVFTLFYHSQLGVQVVIEDYVHHQPWKLLALLASKFAHFGLGVWGIYAILQVALAGTPR